jgi:hypothetical protein
MSLCSAFGQWDATAHQQLFPFGMASWMPTWGVSGISGGCDIHDQVYVQHNGLWQNESSILDISILGRLRLNEYLFICPLYWTFAKKSLTIEFSVLHQELN